MIRLLVPVDGSEYSNRAVEELIKRLAWYRERPEIHLLNVQFPLHGDVKMFIESDEIRRFHHDQGVKALQNARDKLQAAGVSYVFHVGVGEPAQAIARYADEKQCDQIFMGTRGLGTIAGLLLGSVATKVIHLTKVPVLLVK